MSLHKRVKKIYLLSNFFAVLLIFAASAVSIIYALTTVADDFATEDYLHEILGGYALDGILYGNDDPQDGNVLSFDGSGDYVAVNNTDLNWGSGDGTVSAWIKTTSTSDAIFLRGKRYAGGKRYQLYLGSAVNGEVRFNLDDDSNNKDFGGTVNVQDGNWHFVVGVRDGNLAKIYVDGVLDATQDITGLGSLDDASNQGTIGAGNNSAGTQGTELMFDGNIAQVRVHSTALTAEEIARLYATNIDPQPDYLEGYWKLDEGADNIAGDSSDNENDGTIYNASWTTDYLYNPYSRITSTNFLTATSTLNNFKYTTAKKPADTAGRVLFSPNYDVQRENVLSFDGDGDYVDTATILSTSDATAPMSIGGWIRTGEASTGAFWGQYIQSNSNRFAGYISGGKVIYFKAGTIAISDTYVDDGGWHHVVFTKAGSGSNGVSLYIDGVLEDTGTDSLAFSNNAFRIGHWGDVASTYFDGEIADVRVYDDVLNAQEVLDLYNNTPIDDTNLVGYWKLDEGAGNTATDSSDSGNNGTITGATWASSTDFAHKMADWLNAEGDEVFQGGYSFDGDDDYIRIDSDTGSATAFTGATDFTISMWVRGEEARLIRGTSSGDPWSYMLTHSGFYVVDDSPTTQLSATYSNNLTEWRHIVGVYDANNELQFYINGELMSTQSSGTVTIRSRNVNSDVYINSYQPSTYNKGDVADVRIYSEALTAQEIYDLYAGNSEPDDTNLEGWWKLDGNTLDSSVNGNDGTNYGATPLPSWASAPAVGQALEQREVAYFDASDDYIEVADDDELSFTSGGQDQPFSLGGWVNLDENSDYQVLFAKYDDNADEREYRVGLSNNNIYFGLQHDVGATFIRKRSTQTIDRNVWKHVFVTYDGSENESGLNIYIDGILSDYASNSSGSYTGMTNGTAPFTIGSDLANGADMSNLDGRVANVAIFNDELSASEVRELYLNGYVDTSHEDLVSYWPLNGDDNDIAGSNNGTCTDCPTYIDSIDAPIDIEPTEQTLDITAIKPRVAEFDGVDDYISVSDSDDFYFGSDDFSIAAWIKVSDNSQINTIYQQVDAETDRFHFDLTASGKLRIYAEEGNNIIVNAESDVYSWNEGVWYQVVVTRSSAGNYNFYRNDSNIGSISDTSSFPNYSGDVELGWFDRPGVESYYFDGQISNIAIYNDIRTAEEIAADYTNRYTDPNDANLVAYYPLSNDFHDHSGNGNHGTNNGAKLVYSSDPDDIAPGILETIHYKTYFTTTDYLGTYALDGATLEYTVAEFAEASSEEGGIVGEVYGKQTSYTTATTDIALGGAFSLINEYATSTVTSLKFDQAGTLDSSYIDNLTLYYETQSGSTTCPTAMPESGLTQLGSGSDLSNGSTTIDSLSLEVGSNRICIYPTYDLDSADEYSDVGKSIDLVINATSSVAIEDDEVITLSATPLDVFGKTILAQEGVQTLTVDNSDGSETTIYVQDQVLWKKVGDAPPQRLTSNDVKVVYAQFTDLSDPDAGNSQVRVELRIKYDGYNYVGSDVVQNYVTTVNIGR